MRGRVESPRLQAYLEHTQGHRAFASPRSHWDSLSVLGTQLIAIDVTSTPLESVANETSLIAVVASQTSTGGGQVSVYRHDPKDVPTPINVDHYSIWTDIASHPQIERFVSAASTALNSNLRQYLAEKVLWVKEAPGVNHWLTDVPPSVVGAVRIGGT